MECRESGESFFIIFAIKSDKKTKDNLGFEGICNALELTAIKMEGSNTLEVAGGKLMESNLNLQDWPCIQSQRSSGFNNARNHQPTTMDLH